MKTFFQGPRKSAEGFILIGALLAIWILTSLGILVFVVSTQDIRISSRGLGEKKAFAAAEAGIHALIQNFDPLNKDASIVSQVPVDPANDPDTRFSIAPPPTGWIPSTPPASIPYPGFSMGGGQVWGQTRTLAFADGANTRYKSNVQVEVGIGYGPVNITTNYP